MVSSALLGLGCMRLSTALDRDEARAEAVIAVAFEAGVRTFDTARAYGHDDDDRGHNERLLSRSLGARSAEVTILTKGGMTRPGGRWVPDGRQSRLVEDCEHSLTALGRIDLYLLHAPDPRVSIAQSARALERLRSERMVGAIGLCNVGVAALEAARAVADIRAVQVALSPYDDDPLWGGLVRHCLDSGIRVIAHSPLGGPKRSPKLTRHGLAAIAEQKGVTAAELTLAWLADLGVTSIAGATRCETARSIGSVADLTLSDVDRAALDGLLPGSILAREPRSRRRPPDDADGEVVLLMGIQGAGKSDMAASLCARGYERLNRDARGGRLDGLLELLDRGLASGARRWVLDNTYASSASRARVVELAWRYGVPARCVWLDTPLAEAQINAVRRLRSRHGEIPIDLMLLAKRDPQAFDPRAQFRYERELEPPRADEGFSAIERVPFVRRPLAGHEKRGIIFQCEGVLRQSASGARSPTHPEDVVVLPGRSEVLKRYAAEGWALCAISWQPAIAAGEATLEQAEACFERTRVLLDVPIAFRCCPHAAGPPRCWCRTPLPGLAVAFIDELSLDPARSLLVGTPPADRTLAERVGMPFATAEDVFDEVFTGP